MANTIEEALLDADAAIILTEWDAYTKIDWKAGYQNMRKPAWVFDSRSIIQPDKVTKEGLNFWRLGDGLI